MLFGYVLGRSHKARTAAMLALMVVAGRSSGDIVEMLRRAGLDKALTDLRGQLAETGKGIAEKAGTTGTGSLGDLADVLLGSRDKESGGDESAEEGERADEHTEQDEDEREKPARRAREKRHEDDYEEDSDDEYEDYAETDDYPDEEEPERRAPSRAAEAGRRDAERGSPRKRTAAR
ncbi:hypothetical protein [Actinocorallia aurea]